MSKPRAYVETLPVGNAMQIARIVQDYGTVHESRIGRTSEILNATFKSDCHFIPYRAGMARKLGLVEILQFWSGYFDQRHIKKVVPKLKYDYGHANAYGQKVSQQLPKVIEQLRENRESRRATLYIGKPEDGQETTKPCMQMIQFQIRDKALYTSAYARSWDAIHGLPYDVMMFNGVAQIMAQLLNVYPERLVVHAGSLHVYDKAWRHALKQYEIAAVARPRPYSTLKILYQFQDFDEVRNWAHDQLNRIDDWKSLPEGVGIR